MPSSRSPFSRRTVPTERLSVVDPRGWIGWRVARSRSKMGIGGSMIPNMA